jgi:hypothetical protein
MRDVAERYREEDGFRLIEINLPRIQQLFNSLDPSPFHEKDLDADAEDYIIGAVREFPLATPLKLVLHMPEIEAAVAKAMDLETAIHRYFSYRRDSAGRDLRFLLRQGRLSLVIGLGFLAICLSLRALLLSSAPGAVRSIVAEGLMIAGWVAMWRPIQTFLYDWWPVQRLGRIFEKLSAMTVEIRPYADVRQSPLKS